MTRKSKFEVREIAPSEHAACATIYASAWNGALPAAPRVISSADFEGETEGERILVGILNGQIAGYVSIWEPDWFIHHLYVDPLVQGAGLGRALMSRAVRLASPRALSLKCQLANTGAIGFYKSLGFRESSETGTDEHGSWVLLIQNPA